MIKRKAPEEYSIESNPMATQPHPENSSPIRLSEHQSLALLIDPIRESLDEVKRVYIASLLSTGSSEISSEIFLDHLSDSPQRISVSHEKIADIANYMLELEGKWLRPVLVLLTTDLLGQPPEEAAVIAAALELIHNATLIHDDIIDESDVRRGRSTIWRRWGNFATVLMGDLLYAKSMELTTSFGNLRLQQIIAQATARMCQGELHQLQWAGNLKVTEAEYIQVVNDKTACLISACTQCGALIAKASEITVERMRKFGLGLGMAFQITDDILDFVADPEELGKSIGNDIAHGKITLPLIHFLANSTHPEPAIALITGKNGKEKFDMAKAVQSTGSIDYARHIALQYIDQAKQQLDEVEKLGVDSEKIQHLKQLSDFVVNRRF